LFVFFAILIVRNVRNCVCRHDIPMHSAPLAASRSPASMLDLECGAARGATHKSRAMAQWTRQML
jgi:hypothetical protein